MAIEILIFVNMAISLVILSRHADRSREADRHEKWLRGLPPERLPTVDVFLTTYNEGREFIERGIVTAKALDYPRFKVWVLDDGRRDWLRDLCAEREVGYIRRPDNKHAKAGNINHALKRHAGRVVHGLRRRLHAPSQFPVPHGRLLLFRSADRRRADAAAFLQSRRISGQPGARQRDAGQRARVVRRDPRARAMPGTAPSAAAPAPCFAATPSQRVGGIATESVTEDILTTVKMLPGGYITRYLNERLSMGLAPEDAKGLMIQRQALGAGIDSIDVLDVPPIRRETVVPPLAVLLSAPLPLRFPLPNSLRPAAAGLFVDRIDPLLRQFDGGVGCLPRAADPGILLPQPLAHAARADAAALGGGIVISFRCHFPRRGGDLDQALRHSLPGHAQRQSQPERRAATRWRCGAWSILIALTVGGIIVGCHSPWRVYSPAGLFIAAFWALCNLVMFGLTMLAISQRSRPRGEERFFVDRPATLTARGQGRTASRDRPLLDGAPAGRREKLERGESIRLDLEGVGELSAAVVRNSQGRVAIHFADIPQTERDKLSSDLYAPPA